LPGTTALIEATPGGTDGSIALVVSAVRAPEQAELPVAWGLSAAESRVAQSVIQGQSNREVADQLSISENTVEWHLRRIFDKVGVRSRSQLMAMNLADGDAGRVEAPQIA
jgi:DNA-binding CsgD family transcriptional regulator